MKRTQLILLFVLVFSAAFLLGITPEGKAAPPISVSEIEFDGQIKATLEGQVPVKAYFKDADGNFQPMIRAERAWITHGPPDVPVDSGPTNGREINNTTLGAAVGSWVVIGGRYYWVNWP